MQPRATVTADLAQPSLWGATIPEPRSPHMPRILRHLPLVALALATAALFYAGFTLRDPASVQRDRQKRRDFAVAVQRGEMPRVPARNVGGALRQEIEAQDAAATARARLATWLQVAARSEERRVGK